MIVTRVVDVVHVLQLLFVSAEVGVDAGLVVTVGAAVASAVRRFLLFVVGAGSVVFGFGFRLLVALVDRIVKIHFIVGRLVVAPFGFYLLNVDV